MKKQRALFLDRDGTLIRDVHYLKDPDEVEIIEGIGDALLKAANKGYYLFMHTNQSGIARGYYDWPDVYACNIRMHHNFGWPDNFFTEVCIAPETPDKTDGYRKPSPRFEQEMTHKFDLIPSLCWVVGDKWIDPKSGLDAGMRGSLVETGKPIDNSLRILAKEKKVPIYKDLAEFLRTEILEDE